MKAFIIVTVLAMATSAIAVPLSRQAKAQALLTAMQDNAEMEGWLGDAVVKYGPTVLKTGLALGGALLWDEKLDRKIAIVQKKAEIDEAEMEGWLSDIGDPAVKYGPGLLKADQSAGLLDEELNRESATVQMFKILKKLGKLLPSNNFMLKCEEENSKYEKGKKKLEKKNISDKCKNTKWQNPEDF